MSSVTIANVAKSYGSEEVLHDINIDIKDGEFIVIVGPSGCGKSTLLRMVAGLERISSGDISIGDRIVNEVEPKDRDIAMVFQNYALYPHMTVFKNMAYGLKLQGIPKEEIAKRVGGAAKMLQLERFLERRPRELSGGQRQRVAMGRAIVREPSVFLFDEPLSNLDAKLRVLMRLEIRALQRRLKVTSLYVTHDQTEAMTLADRLIVLNNGTAEQIDTPLNIYERPATVYVAGFIGSPAMNFFKGKIAVNGKQAILESGAKVKIDHLALGAHAGKSATVGIRPETLELCTKSDAHFLLEVTAIETLGSETLAHGVVTSGKGASGEPIVVKLPGASRPEEGEILPLKITSAGLHLFDAETGLRFSDTGKDA